MYEHLEPWIQWVTAHTGLDFAEHGVFRLGDIVARDLPQIWEQLEEKGLRVGAICPMNAKHRLKDAASLCRTLDGDEDNGAAQADEARSGDFAGRQ